MSLQKFWMEDEEEGCMNCGELDFAQSKTYGLCIRCNPTDPRYFETYEDDEYYSSLSSSSK